MARIQLTTWRFAYRRLLPPGVLDELDGAWLEQQWQKAISEPPSSRHRVFVAVEQQAAGPDYLVGFAAAGPLDAEALAPQEDPDAASGPGGTDREGGDVAAITELVVEPRWGRRGHGSRLLAALVDAWRADGFRTAVAWAYEQDPATRTFLASAGWEPDGATRALDVDDMMVPQLRLHVSFADDGDRDDEPPGNHYHHDEPPRHHHDDGPPGSGDRADDVAPGDRPGQVRGQDGSPA